MYEVKLQISQIHHTKTSQQIRNQPSKTHMPKENGDTENLRSKNI